VLQLEEEPPQLDPEDPPQPEELPQPEPPPELPQPDPGTEVPHHTGVLYDGLEVEGSGAK
jgi:hypothetical protein